MKKTITILMSLIMVMLMGYNSKAQIIISGLIANPGGTDSTYEYVQLVATQNIDFATSNYSVVFTNNGSALATGWIAGNAISYGFNLTSGTVAAGSTFYVGGSGKRISGSGSTDISSLNWIKTINTVTTAGDGFGNVSVSGVLGNGGANADGIAVFSGLTSAITSTTVPVDAIFYGTGVGTAKPATGGYVLPNNDRYSTAQGTFGNGTNTFVFPDAFSNVFLHLSGTYNTNNNTWSINRTGVTDTLTSTSPITQIATQIVLSGGTVIVPTVSSVAAIGITQTSATCGGNVTSDGGGTITERGICYGATADPTIAGTKVVVAGTNGAFTGNVTGLTANTPYHFRAYATNSAGTSYGSDLTFTTASGAVAPVVSTGAVSAITSFTATVAGDVTNDGGSAITERGICWSTTANPTTANTKVAVSGTTGVFSGNLTGLTGSTVYYARAYAINAIGTSYGSDINFTTAVAAIPCATIAELRAKIADNSTLYQLTGEAFLTYKHASRNQKYIQDATAAVLIDDPNPAKITTIYNIGDGITGIKGKLYNYFGLLEFIPVEDPGMPTSINNVVNPLALTAANMQDTAFMRAHQSKLVKFNSAAFTDGNGIMKFSTNKKYRLTEGGITDSLFYTFSYTVDYITPAPLTVPSGNGSIIGNVNMSFNKYYITARSKNDISLLVGINEVENETVGVYPNPTSGKFTVNIDKFNSGDVKIYSMVGTLITSQQVNKGTNEFDLSAYGKGMYFVKYTDAKTGKSWTEKLIVK